MFSYDSLYCVCHVVRKHEPHHKKNCFCICEKEDVDQLRGNRETDQCLSFRYKIITIPQLDNTQHVQKTEPGWKSNNSNFSS